MTQQFEKIRDEVLGKGDIATTAVSPRSNRVLNKIVLVDDSATIHQLLRMSFKRYPEIQIATLGNPTTAIEFVRCEKPDLVLLDVNMPQSSGKQVILDIKSSADLQDVPVAFLTADDGADERKELLDIGAWYVFKKPFMPKTFADELIKVYYQR
jgi:DNA-binding response OmpR family regulator